MSGKCAVKNITASWKVKILCENIGSKNLPEEEIAKNFIYVCFFVVLLFSS